MSISKTSKMLNFINYRMRVTIQDSRQLVGTFMAFDKHMNLVLGDCMEYRRIKGKKGEGQRVEKRTLGLILLRGETVVSMQIEGQPSGKHKAGAAGKGGKGAARAAGRGLPVAPLTAAPAGLAAPVAGVGGASGAVMQPQIIAQPPRVAPAAMGRGMVAPMMGGPPHPMMAGQPPQAMMPPPPHGMMPPPPMGRGAPPPPQGGMPPQY